MIGTKLAWVKFIILTAIFVAPLLTLSLPQVTLPGPQTLNAKPYLAPLYAEDNTASILSIGNYSQWSLSPSTGSAAALSTSANSLDLSGAFQPSSSASALTVRRQMAANVTRYPLFYVHLRVTVGVGYGIRFFSHLTNGNDLGLWSEGDSLNHRSGTGGFENIQVNLKGLSLTNTGRNVETISEARVYLERPPNAQTTSFELAFDKFEFLNYPLEPAALSGAYHAIYLSLNRPQVSQSWKLTGARVEASVNASTNTITAIFLIDRESVRSLGVFKYDSTLTTQLYSMSFSGVPMTSFPDSMPQGDFSIVIIASSGVLYKFVPESLSLNYFSSVPLTSSSIPTDVHPAAYLEFLGVALSVCLAVFVYDHVRNRRPVVSGDR